MQNRKNSERRAEELFAKFFSSETPNIKADSKEFHITITDNRTGEKKIDADTNCIIGGYDVDGEMSSAIAMTACSLVEIVGTAGAAKKAIVAITADKPLAKLLLKMGE